MTVAAERFFLKHHALPTMPEVASRLLKSFDDDNIGLAQIAALIEKDAALTAKVDALASQGAAQPDSDSTLRQILGAVTSLSSQLREAEARLKPTPIDVQAIADPMAAQAARTPCRRCPSAGLRRVASTA